ncbi:MAG: RecQ family ATP-dependent DNA helicase [Planctomycetaceae bacterium]|nr:RecQ family ATP-dependent DNA helicase [Planctomycetaceae bacterium]
MGDKADPATLLSRFGLTDFRAGQREVVDAVANGQDVMCVMPTGGGKSLCYQLPSLAREGTTIVVSPLIALMKDQVDTLQKLGIDARLINSTLTAHEQADVMRELSAGSLDLVYVAPERLRNGRFLEAVAAAKVTLLAVDEAHCVSEWGHDFRPDYARLGQFRKRYLNNVQTIALTATATPMVRQDISGLLNLQEPEVFVTGFSRDNLRFSVGTAKSDREKDEQLLEYLREQTGSGIIYAATRKRCEELADWLPEKIRRPIGVYHAGLDVDQRRRVQDDFMAGKLSAIVATNAFGMGIDKADIRFVIHYNMPGTLEAYYQEAGRAGRDSQTSDCRLLFSYSDRYLQEFFIENRYPARETVRKVYEFLVNREEDPIELTLDQVRAAIDIKEGSEAIGTSETLLAKAGVLRRLDSNANHAMVRIDSNAATMLDFLPKEAKLRRRVMQAVEKVVGKRRGEDVFVKPKRLAELAKIDRNQLSRTLRELKRLRSFDFVPPFRGRAVHFLQRDLTFDELEIDFEELEKRKAAEFEKLESVIGFARSQMCRQLVILRYFGETTSQRCGSCDRCRPQDAALKSGTQIAVAGAPDNVNQSDLVRGVRVVLSGVTRMHGRFGKQLVAQMLCGSKSKKLQQWKLHRLSTYGLLSAMKQTAVADVIDCLAQAGLVEQKEVDQRRPTVQMTESGRRVMLEHEPVPDSLTMPTPLAQQLARATKSIESRDVQTHSAGQSNEADETENRSETETELLERLKRWRRKISAALGIPAYRVLTNATIERIAESSPKSTSQLESISGVGPATIEQYGDDLIELIGQTLDSLDQNPTTKVTAPAGKELEPEPQPELEQQAKPDPANRERTDPTNREHTDPTNSDHSDSANSDRSGPTIDDLGNPEPEPGDRKNQPDAGSEAYWTWRLFKDGYSTREIESIRGRDLTSLDDDLITAATAGLAVEPRWFSSAEARKRVEKVTSRPSSDG